MGAIKKVPEPAILLPLKYQLHQFGSVHAAYAREAQQAAQPHHWHTIGDNKRCLSVGCVNFLIIY
jgi:hypothetical protein